MSISLNENLPVSMHLGALACSSLDEGVKIAKVAVVNLMPMVQKTEWDFATVLGYYEDIHVDLVFFHMKSRPSSHEKPEHFAEGYEDWEEYDFSNLDAIIVTGAPIESVPFEEVTYWKEITALMDKADKMKLHMLLICWGAQAGLHHFHKLEKKEIDHKYFGVFEHKKINDHALVCDMKQPKMCVSRHTTIDVTGNKDINVLLESSDCGLALAQDNTRPHIFYMQNHFEYDKYTLKNEYERDMERGRGDVKFPENYTTDNTLDGKIIYDWHDDCKKFFYNFLNMISK